MKTACVIVNYNDAETAADLVGRIHGYRALDHIVLVDNASTDDSFGRLELLADDMVSVIRAEKNGGYGAGNNLGVQYAREQLGATHVLIANPDVYFSDECVRRLRRVFMRHPEVGAAAAVEVDRQPETAAEVKRQPETAAEVKRQPEVVVEVKRQPEAAAGVKCRPETAADQGETAEMRAHGSAAAGRAGRMSADSAGKAAAYRAVRVPSVRAVGMPGGRAAVPQNAWRLHGFFGELFFMGPVSRRLLRGWLYYPAAYFRGKKAAYVDVVHGSMLMADAEAFQNCGGYDEGIFLYQEEAVLARRLREAGYRTVLLPDEMYIHRHSVSINKSFQDDRKRQRLREESVLYYMEHYLGIGPVRRRIAKLWFSGIRAEMRLADRFLRPGR